MSKDKLSKARNLATEIEGILWCVIDDLESKKFAEAEDATDFIIQRVGELQSVIEKLVDEEEDKNPIKKKV